MMNRSYLVRCYIFYLSQVFFFYMRMKTEREVTAPPKSSLCSLQGHLIIIPACFLFLSQRWPLVASHDAMAILKEVNPSFSV